MLLVLISFIENQDNTFNIDKMCTDPNTSKYLSYPCRWQKNQTNSTVEYQKYPKEFSNYLKNTPLKYDGVWDINCNNQKKCKWKSIN